MRTGLSYLPVEELGERPHVMVDGASRRGTVLTLSHWPQEATPPELACDLSAQIVFKFLHLLEESGQPRGHRQNRSIRSVISAYEKAERVTNDHFDEDGLVSVFALVEPETALSYEDLLAEVASCGDFGVVRSRRAARIAFAIGPLAEQITGAVSAEGAGRPGSWSGIRYQAVLERFVELIEHTERFEGFWAEADASYATCLARIASGEVVVEEIPEVDLAVVTGPGGTDLDQTALHSSTQASRILVLVAGHTRLYMRYEGWVRYVSRHVPLRPDLAPLAGELSAAEPSSVVWAADGVGSIVTGMRPEPDGTSGLDPDTLRAAVVSYLTRAPGAWDPFRPGGPLIPLSERRPAG